MSKITTLGIDLAKNIFQLHGTNERGQVVLKKRLTRKKLPEFMANLPICTIGMEACGGAHYWAREFKAMGHLPKLMAPQYVKPYVKTNKNDQADAQACNEAVTRPSMRFVSIKSIEHQDMQTIHRIRSMTIKQRTQLSNHIRGLLLEYGIEIARGRKALRGFEQILEDNQVKITEQCSSWLRGVYAQYCSLEEREKQYDKQIKCQVKANKVLQRLMTIPGIGPLNATGLLSGIGCGEEFNNGRHLAAWLGLVPKQFSSGNQQRLLGISKRGDRYLRTLLAHGARSVVKVAGKKTDPYHLWIQQLLARKSYNEVCTAVANKNARIVWSLLSTGEDFDANKASAYVKDNVSIDKLKQAAA